MSPSITKLDIKQYTSGFIDVMFLSSKSEWDDGGFCILPQKITRTKFDSILNILYSNHKYGDTLGRV